MKYAETTHSLHYSLLNSNITLPVAPSAWINDTRMTSDTLFTVVEEKIGEVQGIETFLTRVGTLIVATIYLQLIQNRYMFRSFTVLQCSYQHCVQLAASDVEVVGYL